MADPAVYGADTYKWLSLEALERGFNQGDLSVWDEVIGERGVDHQEAPGVDFRVHLREAATLMRRAFPDLHFTVHHALAESDVVAFHSTMTGTHLGPFEMGPFRHIVPAGNKVEVRHMHFLRWENGKNTDLWHLWDTAGLLRQLEPRARDEPIAATGRS